MRWGSGVFIAVWLFVPTTSLLAPDPEVATTPCGAAPDFQTAIRTAEALPRFQSLLISQRGELRLERYFHGWRAGQLANVKSVSKSVISTLVGIAIERKLLSGVDERISRYFPELKARGVDARKRDITIDQLLSMHSGLVSTSNQNYGSWVRSANWVRYVLNRPLESVPGAEMHYSTGNTHLLSAILTKATGKSTWAFAQEALAEPLGITLPRWPQDPQGVYFGGNEMLMTPAQMLRLGELYRNHGRAGGRQVVPAAWIETSFVPRGCSPISGKLYGYGWWIHEMAGQKIYYAWGFGGQYIFVVPSLELVVVTTSSPNVGEDRQEHRSAVWDMIENLVIGPIAAVAACS